MLKNYEERGSGAVEIFFRRIDAVDLTVIELRLLPPSSSGPGRGPLKAKTGVRVPVGAPAERCQKAAFFLIESRMKKVYSKVGARGGKEFRPCGIER